MDDVFDHIIKKVDVQVKDFQKKHPHLLEGYEENVWDKDMHRIIMEQKNYWKKRTRGYKFAR